MKDLNLSEKAHVMALLIDERGETIQELAMYIEYAWAKNSKWYEEDMEILKEHTFEV